MTGTLPKTLGRYEIKAELGRGMMGVVYLALDPALSRTVALKTINVTFAISEQERGVFEQRFVTEARLAAQLSHRNIVVVHDVGRDEATGTPYIALEFLKGKLLSEAVPPPLEWKEALRIVGRLADALHVAHEAKIVHRDIKPANVMILEDGEPKIMDFGIARAPTSNLTAAGEFFGTPSYMSPEQAAGDTLDGRSDLFSLGAVLYFLLSGARAFEGKSVPAILSKVERENPARPSSLVQAIPQSVDLIVARLLHKKPEHRYPDGRELAEDIDDALHDRPPRHAIKYTTLVSDPTLVGRAPTGGSTRPAESSNRLLALAAVLVAALIGTLFIPRLPPLQPASPSAAPGELAPAPSGVAASSAPPRPAASGQSPAPAASDATPSLVPETPSASASRTARREEARLTLDVKHGVKEGVLRVLVDQKAILTKTLTSRETKKVLFFKGRTGQFFEVIDLAEGERTIRVEVEEGDETKAGQILGTFKKGEARLLEVRVGRAVELEWR